MANGMFDAQVQSALNAQMRERAKEISGFTPGRAAIYSSSLAGQNLGRSLGGMLGIQSPEEVSMRNRMEAASKVDFSSPDSLIQSSRRFLELGDIETATKLYEAATQARNAANKATELGQMPSNLREKMIVAQAIQREQMREVERGNASPSSVQPIQEIFDKIAPLQTYQGGFADQASVVMSDWKNKNRLPSRTAEVSVNGTTKVQPSSTYTKLGELDAELARLEEQMKFAGAGNPYYDEYKQRYDQARDRRKSITDKMGKVREQFTADFGSSEKETSLVGRLTKIQTVNQLLEGAKFGNEASVKQLNEALSDLQGAHKSSDAAVARTSTAVAVGSKLADFISKTLTGKPSEGMIEDIRGMLKDMEDLYRREAQDKITRAQKNFRGVAPQDIVNQVYNIDNVGFREPIIVDQEAPADKQEAPADKQEVAADKKKVPIPLSEALNILNQNPTQNTISYFISTYGYEALPDTYKAINIPVGEP